MTGDGLGVRWFEGFHLIEQNVGLGLEDGFAGDARNVSVVTEVPAVSAFHVTDVVSMIARVTLMNEYSDELVLGWFGLIHVGEVVGYFECLGELDVFANAATMSRVGVGKSLEMTDKDTRRGSETETLGDGTLAFAVLAVDGVAGIECFGNNKLGEGVLDGLYVKGTDIETQVHVAVSCDIGIVASSTGDL